MSSGYEKELLLAFIDKIDAVNLVLIAVIILLSWLLWKTVNRMDTFLLELNHSGQTMNKLTMLLENLVYGRHGDKKGDS
jgi:hypothetical protein